MLGKEACGGKRCHGIRAQSFHRQGLLRQQAAAAGQAKQPQIRSGAGKCRLRLFAEPGNDPVGGAAQTFDGVAQSLTQFVPKAPRSIRNLIGSVRPSTSPIYWPVLMFFSWLALFTGSTSAKPSDVPLDDPNTSMR